MADISFEYFTSLVYRLGHPPKAKDTSKRILPEDIFSSWLADLPRPLRAGTGKHIFRLLYPHEGARRRYGVKETLLAKEVQAILGVPGQALDKWDRVNYEGKEGGEGCFGLAVMHLMRDRASGSRQSSVSISEVDGLLDTLAAHSPFSDLSQPPSRSMSPTEVLTKLYRSANLSPSALAVISQIILRDLRPILNPLPRFPVRNPTAMLRLTIANAPKQLELPAALQIWQKRACELFRSGKGDVDWCLDMVEAMGDVEGAVPCGPIPGVNVQIPKCRKGRSIEDTLSEFTGSWYAPPADLVWAETKYDGYRMQIHVQVQSGRQPTVTVFSKSKRNSTFDRLNTHSIILSCLGLPVADNLPSHVKLAQRTASDPHSPAMRTVKRSVILEAEVIPYNEGDRSGGRGPGIEEFWWLSAAGVSTEVSKRHLCLAFFDILHVDGQTFLPEPYSVRRQVLESLIRPISGFAFLAERTPIYLNRGRHTSITALTQAFNQCAQSREEGLVLKSGISPYPGTGRGHRWVKLKRDYIPDLGDCIDLVMLGAGWDVDRARELRVDTSVITTFYVGVLANPKEAKSRAETPHFEILSRVSYGMTRDQLEVYNANIRLGRWRSRPFDRDDPFKRRLLGLSWTYHLPKSMVAPSILFDQPMCCEVMGAGFQKLPWGELYELRWPRMQKIFEVRERRWSHALLQTAHQALGYNQTSNPTSSPENDSIRALWRSASSCAIDIVDWTPSLPSPRRAAFDKRNMSAPDLVDMAVITKSSPPTPSPRRSPRYRIGSAGRTPISSPAHRRFMAAINRDTQKDDAADEEEEEEDDHDRAVYLRSPITSPAKRVGTPLFTPSPKKKGRVLLALSQNSSEHQRYRVGRDTLGVHTPPLTSPVSSNGRSESVNAVEKGQKEDRSRGVVLDSPFASLGDKASRSGDAGGIGDGAVRSGGKSWRTKALSLRSRIKLALRGMSR